MTLEQLRRWLQQEIQPIYGVQESTAIARILILFYSELLPATYQLEKNNDAPLKVIDAINEAIPLLINHTPVQYITGLAWFCDLPLHVQPGVLIPRPETEELVSKITRDFGTNFPGAGSILDIGTGSGAIAIALARQWEQAQVYALDFSRDAIEIARQNAIDNKVNIKFLQGDILNELLFTSLPQDFSLIVSNPPYVTESEQSLMKPNVLRHEPGLALFVPDDDPLMFYRQIGRFARKHLCTEGRLWFEINENYPYEVNSLLVEQGFSTIKIHDDFREKKRFISATNKK